MDDRTGRRTTDRGLSSLGLIMQLVGGFMTAVAAGYLAMFIIALTEANGGGGGPLLWILVVLGLSLGRSVAHASAGARLLFDGPGTPAEALRSYLLLAAVHVAVVCVALGVNDAPGKWLVFAALVLGAWPLTLWLVAMPMVNEAGQRMPLGDDGGLDGASVLMLVLGANGAGLALIMVMGWFEIPSNGKTTMLGLALLASIVLLSIRAALHLGAGLRNASATTGEEVIAAANRYADLGVKTGVVVAGLLVVSLIHTMPSGPPMATIMVLIMGAMVGWVLVVWPLAIRRFVRARELSSINQPLAPRSPDRGLPALGWLLLALGVYTLATGLGGELVSSGMPRGGRDGGDNPIGALAGVFGGTGSESAWLGIGVAALQTWAGAELIHLTSRHRTIGMTYGFAAAAFALYQHLPALRALGRESTAVMGNPMAFTSFALVATALVIPVATLVLVQRKVVDRDAIADTFS